MVDRSTSSWRAISVWVRRFRIRSRSIASRSSSPHTTHRRGDIGVRCTFELVMRASSAVSARRRAPLRRFVAGALDAPKSWHSVVLAIIPSPGARVEHPDRSPRGSPDEKGVPLSAQPQRGPTSGVTEAAQPSPDGGGAPLRSAPMAAAVPNRAHQRGTASKADHGAEAGRYNDAIFAKRRDANRVIPIGSPSLESVAAGRGGRQCRAIRLTTMLASDHDGLGDFVDIPPLEMNSMS